MVKWAGSCLIALVVVFHSVFAGAESRLGEFASKTTPKEFFPEGTRFGQQQGDPPVLPVYADDRLLGYVYLNTDFTSSVGYSGKPVRMLVGIDPEGVITGMKLVEHKEPIVLVGVPERRVVEAVNKLIGTRIGPVAAGKEHPPQPDIVSGATVTVLVMADSILRSAVKLVRSGRLSLAAQRAPHLAASSGGKTINQDYSEIWIGTACLATARSARFVSASGRSTRPLNSRAIKRLPPARNQESGGHVHRSLYCASQRSTIGKSLLGDAGYARLRERLENADEHGEHEDEHDKNHGDQQAIIVASNGVYSFKGSAYVRGGIFDRIELLQDGYGTRFRISIMSELVR